MREITDLVVHCSATRASQDFHAADIDRWHRERGWDGIGYHFVIARDGTLETGRRLAKPGAHVEGYNAHSIGICLIGGVDEQGKAENNFTPAQFDRLDRLLRDLHADFPHARILGHRDFPGVHKACPSFDVRHWCAERGIPA